MRILHIVPDLNAGGAEMMMKRLIEAHLDNPHYEHRVVSLRGSGAVGPLLTAMGVEVETLGLKSVRQLPGTVRALRRRIQALRPDIVQTWMYHADLFGGIAARLGGCRRIIWGVRTTGTRRDAGGSRLTLIIRQACARLSASLPARILYVAESARRLHEALGYDRSKGVVIPNGYVLPPETDGAEKLAIRRRLGLPEEALLVGSAGRWSPQKDFPTFVAAASIVASRLADAQFVLIGRELDRGNARLARLLREAGLERRFHLLGERRDIDACLAALDIFALSSIQEGFPNVVAEAMAAAVPCIATDVGDAALLVGSTGIVVEPRRPDRLAAAIAELAAAPGTRRELGRQARARIQEHFSIDAVTARYGELYRDIVRG